MLIVSDRLAPRRSCSSSFSRSAVFVWMLLSSCSLRCLISNSSSPRSNEPVGTGSGGTLPDSAAMMEGTHGFTFTKNESRDFYCDRFRQESSTTLNTQQKM